MVAFHDRRRASYGAVEDVAPGLDLQPGDTLSKSVLAGRYIVRGERTDEGRRYVIHEALPNGRVIERERGLPTRYAARKALSGLSPTQTYDIHSEH